MNLILNNLRAVAVNIDYNRLATGSYQLEDYTLVMNNRPIDYREDDGGDQDDPRITPFNHNFFKKKNGTVTSTLLRKKNVPVLPRVGRNADKTQIRSVQFAQ